MEGHILNSVVEKEKSSFLSKTKKVSKQGVNEGIIIVLGVYKVHKYWPKKSARALICDNTLIS